MVRYLKYNLRWQLGFLICYPCMWFFGDYLDWPTWASVIGFQCIGANIFFWIDKWIFSNKDKANEQRKQTETDKKGSIR